MMEAIVVTGVVLAALAVGVIEGVGKKAGQEAYDYVKARRTAE